MLRVGIVVNEVSGDLLGGALIKALRELQPDIEFEGIAGPSMLAQGCKSLYPMEKFSVMGLVEPLKHLPELLCIRRRLANHYINNPPDVFIGIDAPDFNLGLEKKLRQAGVKTVHYVCPSVWAWRSGRVKTIRKAVDLLLSIFPFETDFLADKAINVRYVGHPLAEDIPLSTDRSGARQRLRLPAEGQLVALLPGSRLTEVDMLASDFLTTARQCVEVKPGLAFVVPLVNARVRAAFEQALANIAPDLPITLIDGHSRDVIQASNVVLTASGTATLETLLLKRPMVVAYRLHWLTYFLLKNLRLVKTQYVALANLLAGEELAQEFIQERCQPDLLSNAVLELLGDQDRVARIEQRYHQIHLQMRQDSGRQAAEAILSLIGKRADG